MSEYFDRQTRFASMVPRLIDKAFELGYQVTLGDAYRDPRVFGPLGLNHLIGGKPVYGHPKSAHKLRLAIDLNLFRGGKYLETTEDHRPLGEFWESIGGAWGGRFGDANHYSLEFQGMK